MPDELNREKLLRSGIIGFHQIIELRKDKTEDHKNDYVDDDQVFDDITYFEHVLF
jgi:hypothetical protein